MVIWHVRVGHYIEKKRFEKSDPVRYKSCILRCRTKLSRMFLQCKKFEYVETPTAITHDHPVIL